MVLDNESKALISIGVIIVGFFVLTHLLNNKPQGMTEHEWDVSDERVPYRTGYSKNYPPHHNYWWSQAQNAEYGFSSVLGVK